MASIFDFLGGMSPEQNQGLLAAAAQVLRNSGPSRQPYSFGQGLGEAIAGYQGSMQQQQQRKMLEQRFAQEQQLNEYAIRDKKSDYEAQERARAQADRIAKRLSGLPAAGTPAAPEFMASALPGAEGSPKTGGPEWLQAYQQQNGRELRSPSSGKPVNQTDAYVQRLVSMAQVYAEEGNLEGANKLYEQVTKLRPEFDTTPRTANDANGNPFQYIVGKRGEIQRLDGILPREEMENINGKWVNPFAQQDGTLAPQDPNQPFSIGKDGRPVANSAYQKYQISRARAGASNVSVNTATKPFLSEIGKGAGEAVNSAYQGALAASKTLQNVEQIRQGLGNAIIGPGANARVTLAQLGQTLGVTGKNTAEQLANTRMVVQGLARQELSAAEGMKGQGQITESERGILRRAESGMIGDFTAPELNTLLNALDKTARYRIGAHQANMQRLKRDPNAQGIVDYMRVDLPAAPSAGSALPGDITDLLNKYGGK